MVEKFLAMMFGYWTAKLLDSLFGGSSTPAPGSVPSTFTSPTPTTVHQGQTPANLPPGAIPVVSPGAVPAPEVTPAGLPPFPSGWTFSKTTPAIVQRAWQLLPLLKLQQVKYETAPGDPTRWLAYRKEPHAGGKTGVTVYTPKTQAKPAPAPSSPAKPPVVTPVVPSNAPPLVYSSNKPPAASSPAPKPPTTAPVVYASVQPPHSETTSPVPGSPPNGGVLRNLRRGMQGPDVADWQRRINIVPADGKFGPVTEGKTKAFQRSRGLKDDGIVGPQTRAAAATVAA